MSKEKNNIIIEKNFEISEFNDENIIFNRRIKNKGRSSKELKRIKNSLPTTTLHFFSVDDFNSLKVIETEIVNKINLYKEENKGKKSIFYYLYNFLEI